MLILLTMTRIYIKTLLVVHVVEKCLNAMELKKILIIIIYDASFDYKAIEYLTRWFNHCEHGL